MRILFVTYTAESAHFRKWLDAARGFGHEVQLICQMKSSRPEGIPTEVVDTDSSAWAKFFGRLRFIRVCRRTIARFRPDIVHIHFMDPTMTVMGWWHFPRVLASIWGSDVSQPRNLLNEFFRRRGLVSTAALTTTNGLLEYMCRAHVGLDHRIIVVPFGVDCDRFRPDGPAVARSARLRIGCVKHLRSVYGIDILIRAFSLLAQEVEDVELVILGEGEQRAELEGLVRESGLENRVRMPGRVKNEEVPQWIRSFDVFAMPSLSESFGVSALEASACGIPVVGSRSGGIPDVIAEGRSGYLVPPRDVAALFEALRQLVLDESTRLEFGRYGRRMVLEKFEWGDCTRKMEAVYQSLAAEDVRH